MLEIREDDELARLVGGKDNGGGDKPEKKDFFIGHVVWNGFGYFLEKRQKNFLRGFANQENPGFKPCNPSAKPVPSVRSPGRAARPGDQMNV
jgi:hypothetical protein